MECHARGAEALRGSRRLQERHGQASSAAARLAGAALHPIAYCDEVGSALSALLGHE